MATRWRSRLSSLTAGLHEFYAGPYRATFARARRDEEDLFMMMVFSEALGVPNPANYYTVELMPVVYDRFHEWHRRMGMDRSPLDSISCC
ncbi:cory-CC-star protein [Citricoccus sp. I39-566]|uniref:cory-CC-star protein n=1 Tax=Citricoccus sp. I39-566 TaxID=3073268 RepID=UPI00286C61F6|nr:cory-CC-star protein [Citricoccus sp. I39-566]WMY78112.1 cory-CC-star protein [Citricoccus sp. I39-566]